MVRLAPENVVRPCFRLVVVVVDPAAVAHLVVLVTIRAGFGLERRLDVRDARAELARQLLKHVVFGDAQKALPDLERHVAVAEVVGNARKVLGFYVQQPFRRSDDLDLASVGRLHALTAAQHPAARQDERDLLAVIELGAQTAFLPQFERQREFQNRKYLWAIGRTSAGSQTRSSPSARTS
jgi:hypothetical protein